MNDRTFSGGQVHRFRMAIAAHIGSRENSGGTVYMEPGAARALAAALIACADDVEALEFSASQFRTVEIAPDTPAPADDRAMYRIVRFYKGDKPAQRRNALMTLAEAKAHCSDPETSSKTCRRLANVRHTATHGAWFDGYELHPKFKGQA